MRRTTQLCKKGLHRLDAANTYEHPSKGPECRECKRDYMRDYMRELRAKMRKPAGKRAAAKRSTGRTGARPVARKRTAAKARRAR